MNRNIRISPQNFLVACRPYWRPVYAIWRRWLEGGEYSQLFDIVLTIQTSTSPNIDPVVKIWMYNTIGRLFSARRSCNTTRIIGALHNNEYFALYSHYSRERLQLSNRRFVGLDNLWIRTPFSEFCTFASFKLTFIWNFKILLGWNVKIGVEIHLRKWLLFNIPNDECFIHFKTLEIIKIID